MYRARVQCVVSVEVTYENKDVTDYVILQKVRHANREGKAVTFTGADKPCRIDE